MVRHKRSPVPSAPQNDESGWQGTLFLRPTTQEDSPPLDEPCTEPVMMADSSSPPSQLANASGERRNMNWVRLRCGRCVAKGTRPRLAAGVLCVLRACVAHLFCLKIHVSARVTPYPGVCARIKSAGACNQPKMGFCCRRSPWRKLPLLPLLLVC